MFRIYCAYSPALNNRSWDDEKPSHVIKIGYTGSTSKAEREMPMNIGWGVGGGRRTAPLGMATGWRIFDWWPIDRIEDEVKDIEEEVIAWFVALSGPFRLYKECYDAMRKVHRKVNGLTEVVCVDVEKLNSASQRPPTVGFCYPETSFFIDKITGVVRENDRNWLDDARRDVVHTV
jgi:hypothetical protein